jgi:hypothetical protein
VFAVGSLHRWLCLGTLLTANGAFCRPAFPNSEHSKEQGIVRFEIFIVVCVVTVVLDSDAV